MELLLVPTLVMLLAWGLLVVTDAVRATSRSNGSDPAVDDVERGA